jgi:hypothetical protein
MAKAMHDPLLAALITKLPADAGRWPRPARIAWLQMMAMAFNVVYGPSGDILIAPDAAHGDGRGASGDDDANAPLPGAADRLFAPPQPGAAQRFHVDRDGFAMAGGRPVAMEELPAGAILWDERVGIESGDASAILWRGIGTTHRSLPPGVTLRPVFDES